MDNTNATDKIGMAAVPGASFGFLKPPIAEGATAAGVEQTGEQVGFNAESSRCPRSRS